MKLAEALILRADYQKRIAQLEHRLKRNANVQEGDKPAEEPSALLAELEEVSAELTLLIQRINRTNAATPLREGRTLADMLAVRDMLKVRHRAYRDLAEAAMIRHDRYSRSEVRFQSTVDVAEIQKRADDLAKEHRELDAAIQAANWNTDLVE